MSTQRRTLRIPEVADLLGVGTSTVQRWTSTGALTHIKVGSVVLIDPADLEQFLTAHREGNALRSIARRTA